MSFHSSRRQWIQQSSLALLGLGISSKSMGNEEGIKRIAGIENGLINLGSNENPYGISAKAKQAILEMMGETNRYPFNVASLQSARKKLGNYYKVSEDQVLITAGSGEGLAMLARHFNKGNIVTADITFGVLPNTAKKIGTKVIEVPLTKEKVHDLPAMMKAINNETQLVYICNPANPTATIVKADELKRFCEEASKKTVVLIDEAYNEFLDNSDSQSMIGLIEKNPNLLVIKTFSKIHAMAGLRIGYVIGHPTLIKKLQPDYFQSSQLAVSVLSLNAAMASLDDEAHKLMSRQKNEAARNYAMDEMKKMGIQFIPSYTNFIFYPVKNYPGEYSADMLKHKIIMRSNKYSDGQWARVSVGTLEEMKQFIQVIGDPKNNMAAR
ncbi:MAG TPA: aminotransferase class I/II-fold pyridoxal phosphate-dependent enzyme [Chitinophagaceae bacterium]|nr:aminotransferase class I/II-fold pyridoxal phosphate-dependent enzyme [Chitinophagaceae bacterium]